MGEEFWRALYAVYTSTVVFNLLGLEFPVDKAPNWKEAGFSKHVSLQQYNKPYRLEMIIITPLLYAD